MKSQVKILIVSSLLFLTFKASAQSILGTWQLTKQENCIESELGDNGSLADEMKSMLSPGAQILRFRDKGIGDESTRILTRKRNANRSNFLYKLNGSALLILDKKSQTLTDTYLVDKLTADTLILSNSSRPCEMRFFIKIKDGR